MDCYQLKKDFLAVQKLRNKSGFGWDDEKQIVTASGEVWADLVKVSQFNSLRCCTSLTLEQSDQSLKIWQTRSFPLYNKIDQLLSGCSATGEFAFRASGDPPPASDDIDNAVEDDLEGGVSGDENGEEPNNAPPSQNPSSQASSSVCTLHHIF